MKRYFAILAPLTIPALLLAWDPIPLAHDASVFMPGSQPGSAALDPSTWCDNCHGDYDATIEPAHNWRGSMMAQAARDPLWLAALTAAEQDAIWLTGTPNAGSLCLRCHTPGGWLAGRAEPVNGSALQGADFDGVSCDACHRMVDPMRAQRQADVAADAPGSLGETKAEQTYAADLLALSGIRLYDGSPYFDPVANLPRYFGALGSGYAEAGSGQYVVDPANVKRGPRSDARPMHENAYSRFHRSRAFCGTCHDVSNAVAANRLGGAGTAERRAAATYYHLERTFSEFMASEYGRGGSAVASNPKVTWAATCQDCHLRKVQGYPSMMPGLIFRNDLALHDLTGGNSWISGILATVDRAGPTFDAYNEAILSGKKYAGAKIDVAGLQSFGAALLDGRTRALVQVRLSADLLPLPSDGAMLHLRIRNNSGHKLISGFPEGRRMWLNVRFFDASGALIGEVNPYRPLVTRRDARGNEEYVSGGELVRIRDDLVYEAKMASAFTKESDTFHFVLATDRTKDNRIPPKGFDVTAAAVRLALPRAEGKDAAAMFSAEEYAGGFDDVAIEKPAGTVNWIATLYYQTTSKEYVTFLRDEINGTATSLTLPAPSRESRAYIVQTDAFFTPLRDWGRAIWDLWLHNGGSEPVPVATLAARRRPVAR
jgi:hypothetical protein